MKDIFSEQSAGYALFRPGYPDSLLQYLSAQVRNRGVAWDCGTGNGQLAVALAEDFDLVYATDISESQLLNATQMVNIIYKKEAAELTTFNDQQFDLITVAQAIHWFRFDAFYKEVYRTLKDEGLFAAVGYGLLQISPVLDAVILHFYKEVLGAYWDQERRYIDEQYRTIPFPFEEIPAPVFTQQYSWTLEQLIGYLNTWSAVRHYCKANSANPIKYIEDELIAAWGNVDYRAVFIPILLRVGRKIE